ncbi:unnamed protein product [Thelazia callipaeda]|uniref:Bee-milk protein n=1 Tax=Thelazia callipaeda TaxID=103827 RepID=A0A0N5D6S1_THECL|nr:unnamed protein product [Thelazia callipaeda]
MWPVGTVVFLLALFAVVRIRALCSMKNLPRFEGSLYFSEYIHYVLSWDCQLTVTRSWNGDSLEKFNVSSDRLHLCKSDGAGSPIHYVEAQTDGSQAPFLVFIIRFDKLSGTNMNIWRVVRINISAIIHRKRLRRTILDSIYTDYLNLSTKYHIRTCAYDSMNRIICFWQDGDGQYAQLYKLFIINNITSEYRAVNEAHYLGGKSIYGKVVGSLPGAVPRVLTYEPSQPSWLFEVPVMTNITRKERRIQEMRQIGKMKGKLTQVAAMSKQSFLIGDCRDSLCEYRYSLLSLTAKALVTCVFTSNVDVISGLFQVPQQLLISIQAKAGTAQIVEPLVTSEIMQKTISIKWLDNSMVIIYALTVASVLFANIFIELLILFLPSEKIPIFEQNCTVIYKYLFPGLDTGIYFYSHIYV